MVLVNTKIAQTVGTLRAAGEKIWRIFNFLGKNCPNRWYFTEIFDVFEARSCSNRCYFVRRRRKILTFFEAKSCSNRWDFARRRRKNLTFFEAKSCSNRWDFAPAGEKTWRFLTSKVAHSNRWEFARRKPCHQTLPGISLRKKFVTKNALEIEELQNRQQLMVSLGKFKFMVSI